LSSIDDIVIASKKKDTYISELAETFTNMHEDRLKLNPKNAYSGLQGARSPQKALKQTSTKLEPLFRCNLCIAGKMSKNS
jgi:hypothetical protein